MNNEYFKPRTNLELAKLHRKREKSHIKSLVYHVKHGLYNQAFQALAWAQQQSTAADIYDRLAANDKESRVGTHLDKGKKNSSSRKSQS